MNFIKAVQHATIGYGIRRTSWVPDMILSMDNYGNFFWLSCPYLGFMDNNTPAQPFVQNGTSKDKITFSDIIAEDWETI